MNKPLTPVAEKHSHSRVSVDAGISSYEEKSILHTPQQMLINLITIVLFKEYNIRYSYDEMGGTEYIILRGINTANLKVECHFFSCYCNGDTQPEASPPF